MNEIRNTSQLLYALKHGYTVKDGAVVHSVQSNAARKPEKAERHFCISVAGHTIGISSMYPDVYSLCKNYVCDDVPEIEIAIDDSDILFEQNETKNSSYGYLETLAVYRKLCEAFVSFDIFLMHGAVIATGGSSYMFTAASGTGKTTHIRKWLGQLEDAYVVNGDKPLIRITETKAYACGTPWCGKEQMETNTVVPLSAIVLMERGNDNEIAEITFQQAFPFLLQQTYRPQGMENMKKTLQMVNQLKGKVRFFRFVFDNMKENAFEVAYQALTGGKD